MEWTPKTFLLFMVLIIIIVILSVILLNNWQKSRKSQQYQAKYPSKYICMDGDVVRSISECLLDNYFYRHGIQHTYEDVIVKSAEHQYKYDWYFPKIDTYIEFFGYSGNKYHKNSEDKRKFYIKNRLSMIEIGPQELDDLDHKIPAKFGKLWDQITTERHCPHCGQTLDDRM